MSGVWVFRNGVLRLIENPSAHARGNVRRKALFHIPTNQLVTSYAMLEEKLAEIGWERYSYRGHPTLLQFHKPSSMDLISLPKDFTQLSSVHMYDIVVKCRNTFEVRDIIVKVQ